tara:strand:- start:137 stop:943 length:807 start_codon:yes stop_codon:yes gene_type:complete
MNFIHKSKKSLGQNFLTDQNITNKIINIANINKNVNVLEIGSGTGSLTKKILRMNPKKFFGIEKDKNLFNLLNKTFGNYNNVKFINEDILNILKKQNLGNEIVVFGNLPYNISTQILVSLLLTNKWPPWYQSLVLMFQKEVAQRIVAKSNTKEFGRLSVISNWRMDIEKHFDVSKNCFSPKPKIDSSVLSFKPKKINKYRIKNPKILENVTRILFSNRRKMINKNFLLLFKNKSSIADKLNIDLRKRPGELSNEDYYNIAINYEKLFC